MAFIDKKQKDWVQSYHIWKGYVRVQGSDILTLTLTFQTLTLDPWKVSVPLQITTCIWWWEREEVQARWMYPYVPVLGKTFSAKDFQIYQPTVQEACGPTPFSAQVAVELHLRLHKTSQTPCHGSILFRYCWSPNCRPALQSNSILADIGRRHTLNDLDTWDSDLSTICFPSPLSPRLQLSFNISHLQLWDFHFCSFKDLVHRVGELCSLRTINCWIVKWSSPVPETYVILVCPPCLAKVIMYPCTEDAAGALFLIGRQRKIPQNEAVLPFGLVRNQQLVASQLICNLAGVLSGTFSVTFVVENVGDMYSERSQTLWRLCQKHSYILESRYRLQMQWAICQPPFDTNYQLAEVWSVPWYHHNWLGCPSDW